MAEAETITYKQRYDTKKLCKKDLN